MSAPVWLKARADRCSHCGAHPQLQGHLPPCQPSGPLAEQLAREGRDLGMARTVAAHPDDAARVDAVLARFIASGRPFSANDTRAELEGVKGSVVGSRFSAASKARRIKRTGNRFPSTDPGTHLHHIDEWIAA